MGRRVIAERWVAADGALFTDERSMLGHEAGLRYAVLLEKYNRYRGAKMPEGLSPREQVSWTAQQTRHHRAVTAFLVWLEKEALLLEGLGLTGPQMREKYGVAQEAAAGSVEGGVVRRRKVTEKVKQAPRRAKKA